MESVIQGYLENVCIFSVYTKLLRKPFSKLDFHILIVFDSVFCDLKNTFKSLDLL
jgi:hypothetical protein